MATAITQQSMQNLEYLRRLLREKQSGLPRRWNCPRTW